MPSDLQPHYDLQLEVLEALATARNYNAWITALTLPHLGENPLEIGSGLGDQAALWLAAGVPRVTLSDLELRAVESLTERFGHDDRVELRRLDLAAAESSSFSAAVAVNVLEHIEDDVGALAALRRLVRPGGNVVLFVPAFSFAMSQFDREIGHYRRYTKRVMLDRLDAASLSPPRVLRYVNAPGLVAWYVGMRLLRRTPQRSSLLDAWDRAIVPLTSRIEQRLSPPFGQSLFVVTTVR